MGLSFDDVFSTELPALDRFLRRRLGRELADDVAAETFAIAYAKWDTFDESRPVRAWLYGIAANLARHHWRAERRMLRAYAKSGIDPVSPDDVDDVPGRLDAQNRSRELAAALAGLRPQDRDILLLYAWAELTTSEIASALGLPVGTVKSRYHRVRNSLASIGSEPDVVLLTPKEEIQ